MKEWSGAEVTGSSDGRREGPESGAPSAGASEVMIVVQARRQQAGEKTQKTAGHGKNVDWGCGGYMSMSPGKG